MLCHMVSVVQGFQVITKVAILVLINNFLNWTVGPSLYVDIITMIMIMIILLKATTQKEDLPRFYLP